MVSQAELKKRRVKAGKQQVRQEQVVARADRKRRLWMSVFIGILALALIAPLAAGLFLDAEDEAPTDDVPTLDLTQEPPTLVDPEFEGASLTGDTPCPAVDGTQERVTSFETAPSGCIDAGVAYSVELGTIAGSIDLELDAANETAATDLFVSLARYGVYEGARMFPDEATGLVFVGNFGSAAFDSTARELRTDVEYPIGSVVLLAELGSTALTGQAAIVATELGAELLASSGDAGPIVGTVVGGSDAIDELIRLSMENPTTAYRVRSATVTEASG